MNFNKVKRYIYETINEVLYHLAILERKYSKLFAVVLLIGGIIRVELLEYNAIKREYNLMQEIKSCNEQLTECSLNSDKLDELEQELDAYKINLIMTQKGVIDSVLIIKTFESYE